MIWPEDASPPLTDAQHPGPPYNWPYGTDDPIGNEPIFTEDAWQA